MQLMKWNYMNHCKWIDLVIAIFMTSVAHFSNFIIKRDRGTSFCILRISSESQNFFLYFKVRVMTTVFFRWKNWEPQSEICELGWRVWPMSLPCIKGIIVAQKCYKLVYCSKKSKEENYMWVVAIKSTAPLCLCNKTYSTFHPSFSDIRS